MPSPIHQHSLYFESAAPRPSSLDRYFEPGSAGRVHSGKSFADVGPSETRNGVRNHHPLYAHLDQNHMAVTGEGPTDNADPGGIH